MKHDAALTPVKKLLRVAFVSPRAPFSSGRLSARFSADWEAPGPV